mgnify:CR=1 FL=1
MYPLPGADAPQADGTLEEALRLNSQGDEPGVGIQHQRQQRRQRQRQHPLRGEVQRRGPQHVAAGPQDAGDGGDGYCNLYIGEDVTWIVTGDSTVSALYCAGTIEDNEGKTVTVKGTDGTVYVKGDGSYTITVTSYEDSADLSGASTTTSWSAYETEKPAELE